MADSQIAAGQSEGTCTIEVAEGTRPGTYTLAVLGQAQVPFNKDATAAERPKTLVSMPSRPITITVTPPEQK
jgi:hypothetical protein